MKPTPDVIFLSMREYAVSFQPTNPRCFSFEAVSDRRGREQWCVVINPGSFSNGVSQRR